MSRGDSQQRLREIDFYRIRRGPRVLQYSGVVDAIRPLPSPPQPNAFPVASSASVWSLPQLTDLIA